MATNIEMNILKEDGNYEILYPKTLGSLVDGKVSLATSADSATSATQLTTSRNLKVSLSSTSSQSFDGSADATSIGVSGTLAVARGGTGVTSLSSLASNLSSYIGGSDGLKVETIEYSGNGALTRTFNFSTIDIPYIISFQRYTYGCTNIESLQVSGNNAYHVCSGSALGILWITNGLESQKLSNMKVTNGSTSATLCYFDLSYSGKIITLKIYNENNVPLNSIPCNGSGRSMILTIIGT